MTLLNTYQKGYLETFRGNRKDTPVLLVKETVTESGDIFDSGDGYSLNKTVKQCVLTRKEDYNRAEGGTYTEDLYQITLSLDDLSDIQAAGVNVYFVALDKTTTTTGDDIHIVDSVFYQESAKRLKIEDITTLKNTNELVMTVKQV